MPTVAKTNRGKFIVRASGRKGMSTWQVTGAGIDWLRGLPPANECPSLVGMSIDHSTLWAGVNMGHLYTKGARKRWGGSGRGERGPDGKAAGWEYGEWQHRNGDRLEWQDLVKLPAYGDRPQGVPTPPVSVSAPSPVAPPAQVVQPPTTTLVVAPTPSAPPVFVVTCNDCGNVLPANARFCSRCGRTLKSQPHNGDGYGPFFWWCISIVALVVLVCWHPWRP